MVKLLSSNFPRHIGGCCFGVARLSFCSSVRPHGKVFVRFVHSHGRMIDFFLKNGGRSFGVVRPHGMVLVRSVRPHGKVLVSHKLGDIILASSVRLSARIESYF